MDGDKAKSPPDRDSETARRALFESAMFMGQNPYALASSDPATAYAQLAAAQMQAYSAMMARHPAFAAAPYSGLGMYPEGLGSPLHSPMNPAFLPGGAEYWHAATTASEHARQLASSSGYDYFASSLNSLANSFSSSVTGLGTVSDAINFEALLRDPTAAQKSFGLYGNPFLMPPYCSMVTMTTTSTSSAHSSPLKQTNAKTTVTSSSTATRSSPAATVSKAGEQTSGSKHRPPELSVPHETTKDQPPAATLPPPAHSSASKSTLKSTESEDVSKDSDDDFLAKEVLNHLKNQQAEFMRREHVLKLQHNAESAKAPPSSVTDKCEAQRELAAEMLRKRQHEHLVNQLRSSQYDAMPNLRKFAEQQMMKTKGKDGEETTDPESSKKQSEAQGNMSSPKATSEQQEYPNKKKLADQIRDHVHKKATCSTSPPLKIPGRPRGRPKSSNKTLLKIPCTNINSPQAQKHKQDDLRERLEAELKQQQLQLKMAKKGLAQHSKEHEKSKGKDGSKLAQVLLGKTASPPPAMQVETSADRPLVATFKTLSSTSTAKGINDGNSDSSSNSSSGSDSEDSSSESSSGSDSESGSNSDSGEPKTPAKRKVGDGAESSGTDGSVPVKKSREVNEEEVRIPLEHGWRRETRIRTVGQRGIVGDVVYYAPCGKMLKSLLEINKYLATNGITDLTRENFNFSTRVGIGDFLELSNDGNNGMISLSEQEVQTLLSAAIQRRPAQRRAVKRTQQKKKEAAKMAAQEKIAKKIEQQEIAKFAMEQRQKKKGEREMRRKEKAKVKLMREQERLKQKERFKQLRQREKQQRQEEMRMERELRAQQLLEAKKRRKEELQNQKYAEAMKKAKERELKRQQAMMLKEQERERRKHMLLMVGLERERRRQHLLLLKALEARKKLEERERMREEKNRERVLLREKKMEQRRLEIQMAYEMKRPVDDLRVKDCKDLPKLDRIPGVKLAGRAFADALMTLEFLHNFGDALDLDDDVVPSLNSLQLGLLNEEDHVEDLLTLLAQLLKLAIDDPGVPNPKEATTKLNQKIGDVDINDDNVSEVLRIFMEARNGKADELSTRLRTIPFQALNATDKSSCLAFLCNELLCSNTVTGEIEESIENISNLRKDKWSVEGKLRNLKAVHAKKINKPLIAKPSPPRDDSNSAMTALSSKQASDDEEDESGHESGADGAMSDGEENASMPVEELEKKIEKLSKQQGQFRSKVFDACRKLRAVDFGVDRYKRRYWVLPHAGGIFVEGVESGDVQEYLTLNPESEQETLDSTKEYDVEMKVCKSEIADWKPESGPIGGKSEAVSCQSGESKCEAAVCKMESNDAADKGLNGETVAMAVDSARVCNDNLESKLVKKCDETAPKKADVKVCKDECVEQKPSVSPSGGECAADCTVEANRVDDKRLAMTNVKIENGSKSSECNSFDRSQSLSNSMTHIEDKVIINGHDQELFKCNSSLAGERSDFKVPTTSKMADVLKCNNEEAGSDRKPSKSETPGHDNKTVSVTPESKKSTNISLNQTLDSTELSSKMDTSSDGSFLSPYYLPGIKQGAANEAQWFSILPKIACDDQSITSIPPSAEKSKADVSGFPPFGFSGQMFSPVSMGQLHNSPFGYGMLPLTSSPYFYQSHASSTRAPSESSMDCTNLPPTQESLHQDPLPIPQGMQNGWWRITDPNQFKALLRCLLSRGYREKHLQRNFQKNMDFAIQHCGKGSQEMVELDITANDREISQNACSAPTPDKRGSWNREVAHDLERSLLDDVESLEERVFNASLQVKGWKLPEKASGDDSLTLISNHEQKTGEHQQYIVEVARTRLAKLETNIERRYLKPPLNKAPEISLTNHSTGSGQSSPMEEEIPKGLAAWRQCVAMATSPSQLSLCMVQLNSAISWEKSVMKVLCQICRLDDNEAELLLCDSCDKGYHTYCFKPPMTDIPDGDWFCYECVSRANKVPHCVRCGKKNGRMAICNNCPVAFHIDCIDPPFQRTPRKWICGSCTGCKSKYTYQRAKYSKARKKQTSESTTEEDAGSNVGSETCPTPEKKSRKSDAAAAASTASTPSGAKTDYGDKAESPSNEEPTKNVSTDFSICWSTLSELEKHPDSKPFHMPVNCKKFPSYRKFIKKPMDFSTLKKNLNNKVYKVTSEFAADVRQIFDNCEVFNEDDSEVGMAGHALRKLFEERWTEFYTDA